MSKIAELFFSFLKIGGFSIGGGYAIIPFIQAEVVKKRGWIQEEVFTDIITISQMTPGPLAVNTSTFVGLQMGGVMGAIAATIGCVLCGIVLALLLYCFFQRYQKSIYVFEVLGGLKAASVGLIISAAATILLLALWGSSSKTVEGKPDLIMITMLGISLFILRRWKINPILIMLATGIAGIVIY